MGSKPVHYGNRAFYRNFSEKVVKKCFLGSTMQYACVSTCIFDIFKNMIDVV